MCDNDELKSSIDELKEQLDELKDSIEDTIESAVSDSIEDAMSNMDIQEEPGRMYILSQDKKLLAPFGYVEAVRIKKGEEPYAINLSVKNWIGRRIGRYENKEAALREMENIAKALQSGIAVYEVK